jgi:hypothetical protein
MENFNGDGAPEKWGSSLVRENAEAKHLLKFPASPESGHNST